LLHHQTEGNEESSNVQASTGKIEHVGHNHLVEEHAQVENDKVQNFCHAFDTDSPNRFRHL
jgi:hypothetical protein